MQRGTIYCTSMAHTTIHDKTDKDDSQHIMPPLVFPVTIERIQISYTNHIVSIMM